MNQSRKLRFPIYLSNEEKDVLKRAADKERRSMTSYIVKVAYEETKRRYGNGKE